MKGFVVGSSTTEISVSSHGTVFTFAAPHGMTLPVLATGTFVEVRGVKVNGVLTVDRLKIEDE